MRTFSATEARINFGRIMRLAQDTPVLIERSGKPLVVILSSEEYERLTGEVQDWRTLLAKTHRRVRVQVRGKRLPDAAELIRREREARDEQIADALR